jgi:hypothetical protein
MSDRHLHILRTVARHSRRRLDAHDAEDRTVEASAGSSSGRRRALHRRAAVTQARVVSAQARRRLRAQNGQPQGR